MTLAAAIAAHQAQIEHRRRAVELEAPDDEMALIDEDVDRARAEMERAWLEAGLAA